MYSILPAFVSALFFGFGIYAILVKGTNTVSLSFFLLCVITGVWQILWAIVFQVEDMMWIRFLLKASYLLVLYVPTSFYLFFTEVCKKGKDRRYVVWSYLLATTLVPSIVQGDLFLNGEYHYFFGYYPRAGVLHPLHVAQTIILALRCFWIGYARMKCTTGKEHIQMKLCLVSLCVYCSATVDYLGNYGIELYPPGIIFLTLSMAGFMWAIVRYDLLHPYTLATSIAHEMRSPLVGIKLLSDELEASLPALLDAYRYVVENNLKPDSIGPKYYDRLAGLPHKMSLAMRQSNATIDTFLAITREVNVMKFRHHSMDACVMAALEDYPFFGQEKKWMIYERKNDFTFLGSHDLVVFILYNLIKNALWALHGAQKGEITIKTYAKEKCNVLEFKDTALGIDSNVMPHIFTEFFSTKLDGSGTGVGLFFCKHVMQAFGGKIRCESIRGSHATFFLEFPKIPA